MIRLFYEPLAIDILAGTAISLLLMRTRLASWSILSTLLVLLFSAQAACFDGQQHLTPKFDASLFAWGRAVQLRAVGGLAIVLLGAPCGIVFGKLIGARRGALIGSTAIGPFGLGLFASSIQLQLAMGNILDHGTPGERFERLHAAIGQSTWLLSLGTAASMPACAAVAIALVRR